MPHNTNHGTPFSWVNWGLKTKIWSGCVYIPQNDPLKVPTVILCHITVLLNLFCTTGAEKQWSLLYQEPSSCYGPSSSKDSLGLYQNSTWDLATLLSANHLMDQSAASLGLGPIHRPEVEVCLLRKGALVVIIGSICALNIIFVQSVNMVFGPLMVIDRVWFCRSWFWLCSL